MERLSLHQLAGNGIQPRELIDIAAEMGCPWVTLFVNASARSNSPYVATPAEARGLRAHADARGVGFYSLEVFVLEPDTDIAAFRPALERGAILGGQRTTVCVNDPDLSRARDRFIGFCAQAQEHGIDVHVEFHAFGTIRSLAAARDFIAGTDTGAALGVDVLHFYRNEGNFDSLLGPQPVPVGHAQLCDGPLTRAPEEWLFEAVADRLNPGEGAFDLVGFLRALPPEIRIDVEVPTQPRPGTTSDPAERCRAALASAREIMRRAFPDQS